MCRTWNWSVASWCRIHWESINLAWMGMKYSSKWIDDDTFQKIPIAIPRLVSKMLVLGESSDCSSLLQKTWITIHTWITMPPQSHAIPFINTPTGTCMSELSTLRGVFHSLRPFRTLVPGIGSGLRLGPTSYWQRFPRRSGSQAGVGWVESELAMLQRFARCL